MLCHIVDDRDTEDKIRQRALGTFVESHDVAIEAGHALVLAWTVSLPDGYSDKVKTGGKNWCHMTPREQHRFYVDYYIPKVIDHFCPSYYFAFEQNKGGHLHMHGMCVIPSIYHKIDLQEIRQTLKVIPLVKKIVRRDRWINLNHIVKCDRLDDWERYLSKDNKQIPFSPIIKRSAVKVLNENVEGDSEV